MQDSLTTQLLEYWKSNHFTNSWIIETNDIARSISDIEGFIKKILQLSHLSCEDYPDTRLLQLEEKHKFISIKQVQKLQEFMHKSPMVGDFKFAIVKQAQLLNINAANSCLKLLEDTPHHSYIFLVVDSGASLLPTIESRAFKLSAYYDNTENNITEDEAKLAYTRLEFVNTLKGKLDKAQVISIAEQYIKTLRDILQSHTNKSYSVQPNTEKLASAISIKSVTDAAYKLQKANEIFENFLQYDLDGKATLILMGDVIYGKVQ